jgi:hypothetical protein
MASKLDERIARLAIVIDGRDRAAMDREAAALAGQLSPKDVAKLPDRWYPALGAVKAGVSGLTDSWAHLWFEAVAELLYQKRERGLPGLLALMDRDDSTYHQYVIVRLLRLAADGPDRDAILGRVRHRLTSLQHVWTRSSVREVVYWRPDDPRPSELMGGMADIVVPRSDGDTVGTYLREMGEEFPVHQARMAEHEKPA